MRSIARTRRTAGVIGLVMAAVLLVPATPAFAEDRVITATAPYESAEASTSCQVEGVVHNCTTEEAAADAGTGAVTVAIGAAPAVGASALVQSQAVGTIVTKIAREESAPAFLASINLDIASIDATAAAVEPILIAFSRASVRAHLEVTHSKCEACSWNTTFILNDDVFAPVKPSPGAFRVNLPLVRRDGSPIPKGVFTIATTIVATVTPTTGPASASFAGTLASVDLAAPSEKRKIRPAYDAQDGYRDCFAELGSTVHCQNAASKATGHVLQDMRVTGPAAGTTPGRGWARGYASFEIDTGSSGKRATVMVANLHVRSAEAYIPDSPERQVAQTQDQNVPTNATAETGVDYAVEGGSCGECNAGSGETLASQFAPSPLGWRNERSSLLDTDIVNTMWVAGFGTKPTAEVKIRPAMLTRAETYRRGGTARAYLDAFLTHITLYDFE